MSAHGMVTAARRRGPSGGWLALLPAAVLAAILLYPLVLMTGQAFRTQAGKIGLGPAEAMLASRVFRSALVHTVEIALTATSLCLLLGLVLALLVSLAPFRGGRALGRAVDSYLAFPSFLIALSLTFLYGNAGLVTAAFAQIFGASPHAASFLYGFWGVVLAEVTFYTPFVMRPLLAGLESLDRAQIEVASSLGAKPARVIARIVLPALLPSLLAGGSLCLLLTLNEFGIMLVMGAKSVITLPLLIYGKAIQQFDYTGAAVVALCDIALSLGLYALYRASLARLGAIRAS